MSSSNSQSSTCSNSSINIPCEIEDERVKTEFEASHGVRVCDNSDHSSDEGEAYLDEPIADEAWLQEYHRKRQEDNEKMRNLEQRFEGNKSLTSWCRCGNCNTEMLQNPKECYCCREIEKCVEFVEGLGSHDQESVDKVICVTDHPGFPAVCLNRWSLELAAGMFKTRDGHRYNQLGTKERFLRVVAYRQFTRMVHGKLKDRRIPLPACAYTAIRLTHKTDNEFKGYEDLESDNESL